MKTAEATELQLDWLVAKCIGYLHIKIFAPSRPSDRGWIDVKFNTEATTARFDPSVNWEFGGPIIEREKIDIAYTCDGWYANMFDRTKDEIAGYAGETLLCCGDGSTPLIAAMRCYVASKLGDEVNIPEELV